MPALRVLVTGASRGLGQGMAIGLAQAGADIAGVSKSGNTEETRTLVEHTRAAHQEQRQERASRGRLPNMPPARDLQMPS